MVRHRFLEKMLQAWLFLPRLNSNKLKITMKPNRILLTGINGQVGHALLSQLSGYDVIGLSRHDLDLTNVDAIRSVIREIKPDLMINPAAYTAVDKAESEPDLAYAINATAPQVMAEEAAKLGGTLIHFSTDYVYDGQKRTPYVETDTVNPQSVYGKSKLAGEVAIQTVGLPHLILRTSWVYGAYGKNFLNTILRLASEKEQLGIVADQVGAPTSSISIAIALNELVAQWDGQQSGIYHFTNTGNTSWHGFACEIVQQYKALNHPSLLITDVQAIKPLTTADYPTPASRPANSCLDNTKLQQDFGVVLPSWQTALQTVMQSL
jgi:dTDP-4-dehydrorhamnose reductase